MICKKCKTLLNDGVKYCSECGTPINLERKRRIFKMPFVFILIISVALVLIQIASASKTASASDTSFKAFATPEGTMKYYVDALSKGDLQRMAEASGVDLVSKKFNYSAFWCKLQTIIPMSGMLPTKYEKYIPMNKAKIMGQCERNYEGTLYSLKGVTWGMNYPCNSAKDTLDFEDNILSPEFMKDLKIKNIKDVTKKNTSKNNQQKTLDLYAETAKCYGADEVKFFDIQLICYGSTVSQFEPAMVLRYGESWYVDPYSIQMH